MKKLILSAIALLLVGSACCVNASAQTKEELKAQKAAQKALLKEFNGYMKTAKKAIAAEGMPMPDTATVAAAQAALQKAEAMPLAENNAEFYLQAGQVQSSAFQVAGSMQNYPAYAASAQKGFEYYKKAYDAAGGNKKIITEAQKGALGIYQQTSGLAMIGNVFYQTKEYEKCLAAFRTAKTAAQEPVIKSNPLAAPLVEIYMADSTINNLSLNCFSVAQYMLNDTLEAIKELVYLKDHATDNTQLNQVLQSLALDYYALDDTLKFEETLKDGATRLPNEPWYITNLINVYINRGDLNAASGFLDQAIASDPNNVSLVNTKGQLLEQQEKIEEALKYYEKALSLDPTNASVNSSLGRYYYNRALAVEDAYYAKKKFDEGDRQAAPLYEKSLPYYEAAYAFDTERKDKGIAIALRTLYGRRIAKAGSSSAEGKEYTAKRAEVSAAYGFE
jgi:tetratricopeptide (TPR) repeat protein